MAAKSPSLAVIISPTAIEDLKMIWLWNAERYNDHHADRYAAFLSKAIYSLATQHAKGRIVSSRPDLRYIIIKQRNRGHGHLAVYGTDESRVNVFHIFHTAQDWQAKL